MVHQPPTTRSSSRDRRASALRVGLGHAVLIIEDDVVLARAVERQLEHAGFTTTWTSDGSAGLAQLRAQCHEVCLLDLMLPIMDGWRVIETAREEGIRTPIIVITARSNDDDRRHVLELGADDYLVKPFGIAELLTSIAAVLRSGPEWRDARRGSALEFDDLTLDPANMQAYLGGLSARLTPVEFRLLYALALDRGRTLTREDLLQRVWASKTVPPARTIDVFIRKIRDKIDRRSDRHTFIHTTLGAGYMFEPVSRGASREGSA